MEPIAIERNQPPRRATISVRSPAAAIALFRPFLAAGPRELLDEEDRLLSLSLTAPAERDRSLLPVAMLLREAVMKGSAGLLIAHNHPGGDPTPSLADIRATRALHEAAGAIGIRLLDHIVVAAGGLCRSFRLRGLL